MTEVTPLHPVETVEGALRNALTIAEMGRDGYLHDEVREGYQDLARLLRHTLNGLSEPNATAIQTAYALIFGSDEATPESLRVARDEAAAILSSQLRGAPPPQHPHTGKGT